MKKHSCQRGGFTLIEVMIAAAVLVVALVGLVATFTGCFVVNEAAGNLTIAINHAQCVMEEMRHSNIPSVITAGNWTTWAQADPPVGGGCNSLDNENIQVTYPSGTGANPLQILVTVNWTEKGRQKNVKLVTLLTER